MATKEKKEKKEKVKKMANKCLLLKTPDSRCFFTEETNYPLLVEFGRTFDAEISVVNTKDQVEVLELEDLVKSICNPATDNIPPYEIVEVKLAAPVKKNLITRSEKLKKTKEVNEYINEQLNKGNVVSLAELETIFPELSKPALANNLTRIKRELQAKGQKISTQQGQYKLID